ncbi:hypothetical protein AB0C18_01925 [Nonomuraea muscovyensis]|uniref:hypothetical protein n=1 Tax=Nonomuraea muscovyensis TaxID=1124761 RepID=UPI0033EC906B
MTDEQMPELLPRVAAMSAQADADLHVRVERLRDRGLTWALIGTAQTLKRNSTTSPSRMT